MRRGLDVEKAEAAFKRAAHKAIHGTREERSGRFLNAGERRDAGNEHREAPREAGPTKQKG
jgi:hypothetical protein